MNGIKRVLALDLKFPLSCSDEMMTEAAVTKLKKLSFVGNVYGAKIYKKSYDVRKKDDIKTVCSVCIHDELKDGV